MVTMILVFGIVLIGVILLSISPVLLVAASFVALDILVFKAIFGRKRKKRKEKEGEA